MNKIKFAVLGYGHIGKRHVEEIEAHPFGEVVAVIDDDPMKTININDYPIFNSITSFVNSLIDYDIISVCTPNGMHTTQADTFIELNKHVIIEKPLCLNPVNGYNLIAKAKNKKLSIFPVLQNRYSPVVQHLKELIADNKLGRIFSIQINCFWNRDDHYYLQSPWRGTLNLDGGTLYTQFSHFIDIFCWIFGKPILKEVYLNNFNHVQTVEFEDSGIVHFELMQGGQGILQYSTCVKNKNLESSITVIGQKGTVKMGGQYMNGFDFYEVEGSMLPLFDSPAPNNYGQYTGSANNHFRVIDDAIKSLNGQKNELPLPEEAMVSLEFIHDIYKKGRG
jgi:predicted dehydrogenase